MDSQHCKVFINRRNVHGALSAYKKICDGKKKPSKPLWTYSEKTNTFSRIAQAGPPGGIPEEY